MNPNGWPSPRTVFRTHPYSPDRWLQSERPVDRGLYYAHNGKLRNQHSTTIFQPTNETAQFTATGTYKNGKSGSNYMEDITNQVVWQTVAPTVATITSGGLVSPTGCGVGLINAKAGNGGLVATASVNVCKQSASGSLGSLSSLRVAAPPETLTNRGDKGRYIALGTYAGADGTKDLTAQVKWSTSDARVATVDSAGLVTLVGSCSNIGSGPAVTVTATMPESEFTASASFVVGSCGSTSSDHP